MLNVNMLEKNKTEPKNSATLIGYFGIIPRIFQRWLGNVKFIYALEPKTKQKENQKQLEILTCKSLLLVHMIFSPPSEYNNNILCEFLTKNGRNIPREEGSLCAQHCLNSLLQGPYFTPVDLSSLAQKMDEAERLRMAECGEESEEYRRFLQQPSGNMDDSGYFSVQVISSALEVWGLELVPYSSTDERVKHVFADPSKMNAFICNYRDHWFTIRQLGNQWFNLNSLLPRPELISDTYLSLFLAQLKNDGYSIFIVFGELPDCDADHLLRLKPAVPVLKPKIQNSVSCEEDPDLQAALQLSLTEENHVTIDDNELQEALRLSMQQNSIEEEDDEALLRKAIHMSLEC